MAQSAKISVSASALTKLLKSRQYLAIYDELKAGKYQKAEELTHNLCGRLRSTNFGDEAYRHLLKLHCFCLLQLGRPKEIEVHLRNIAEFVQALPSATAPVFGLVLRPFD